MRKLRFHADDSLDMLLDTLCNVFGSIILISCLLALIGNAGPAADSNAGASPAAMAARKSAERRLKAAEEELRGLKDLHLKLSKDDDGELAKLVAERDALRQTRERLRAGQTTPADKPGAPESAEDIEKLRQEIRELEKRIAEAGVKKHTAELSEKELLARLEQLKELLKEHEGKNIEYVRFPKEQEVSRETVVMILKHGEVYPMYTNEGRDFPGLLRTPLEDDEDDAFKATPVPSAGWRLSRDVAALRECFAQAKRSGRYAAVHLYPDSFELFRALRPYFAEAGLDFGFQILPQHYVLVFSSKGDKLKKL